MASNSERREEWRTALERLAAEMRWKLEPWQIDVAAEVFTRKLPAASVTGRGDIWSLVQRAAGDVTQQMMDDGRLDQWGNWPDGHPAKESYRQKYHRSVFVVKHPPEERTDD